MKKSPLLFIIVIALFLTPLSIATPLLEIEKIDKGSVVVTELNNPAVFDFIITNKNQSEQFQIYSLLSITMWPKGNFPLQTGESKLEIRAVPHESIRNEYSGNFRFEYQIRGSKSGIFRDTLQIKIVPLKEVLEITPAPITPGDSTTSILIKNIENTNLENINIEFSSLFFSTSKTISLKPYEETTIEIDLNREPSRQTEAGSYIFSANITSNKRGATITGLIELLKKEELVTQTTSKGFVIKTTSIVKTNEGNTPVSTTVETKKDIISRLFTTNSPPPQRVERNGLFVNYFWEKTLNPGETLIVKTTTNYTIPFIILVIIIVIGIAVKVQSLTALTLNKKVSFVRTKKGEFALKVSLHIKARKHVDQVRIIDSLPRMTKLYENFGKKPDKVDEATRRIFWNINQLNKGEKRVYSYIIYSKMNIIGRFELPPALAIYEHNGNVKEILSNKAYFASEKS